MHIKVLMATCDWLTVIPLPVDWKFTGKTSGQRSVATTGLSRTRGQFANRKSFVMPHITVQFITIMGQMVHDAALRPKKGIDDEPRRFFRLSVVIRLHPNSALSMRK